MSTKSNVYSQGGGGTHYEFEVQTAFFICFLLGVDIPGMINGQIIEFRQQAGSLGYETDDLLLKCEDEIGMHRFLFQIKHNLTISVNSDLFKEVLIAAWKDFKNRELFDPSSDLIFLIKSALTVDEKNDLRQLLSWAKVKEDPADFVNEVSRIKAKKSYYELFKSVLDGIEGPVSQEDMHKFFRCFNILEYDFGDQISVARSNKF
jgi:hypothetical protein